MDVKRELRQQVLAKRALLTAEERLLKSQAIQQRVFELPEYQSARSVMTFLDFRDEVETTGFAEQVLKDGKSLIVPRCGPNRELIIAYIQDLQADLESGMWGIREPKLEGLMRANPEDIDLIIVPGVAFDLNGGRLGYGGGYYDRFLPKLRPEVKRVGLAFRCQLVEEVPREAHDLLLDILVTEDEVIRYGK